MATEVLYPHDLLSQRLRPHASDFFVTAPPRRKPHHHRTANTATTTNPSSSTSSTTSRSSSRSPSNNPRLSRKDQKRRREGSGSPPPKPQNHQQQQQGVVVTLLRRGESLDSAVGSSSSNRTSRSPSSSPSSTLVPSKYGPAGLLSSAKGGVLITPAAGRSPARGSSGGDMYAGSAFSMSPAPSDLPLPSFFAAKKDLVAEESVDHSATKDLLRLLRLE